MKQIVSSKEKYQQNRLVGLGQAAPSSCDDNSGIEHVAKCAFQNIPVIEYTTWTVPLPLSDSQLEATFGEQINVLTPGTPQGVASVDSSFASGYNGILQTDMLVVGFGVHCFGEPMSFSTIGNAIPSASSGATPPVSPDVFTQNDLVNGALGPTAGINPATLEWGMADWQALWHLANAYQFRWIFQQRHALVQEMVADVAYFGPYAEGVGMGTSEVPIQQYVAQVNGQYSGLGATARFQPVNFRRIGSVQNSVTGTTFTGNTAVMHPTRDYDTAPVSWGGLRNQGTTGQQIPFRRLGRPVLLEKGIPIGMQLNATDSYHYDQMLRYMSISENSTSGQNQVAVVQIDASYAGLSASVGGVTGHTALELTLDSGGNFYSPQQVQTNRSIFKGGVMKLAILVKGFEVWGEWKKYFASNKIAKQFIDMPSITGSVSGVSLAAR